MRAKLAHVVVLMVSVLALGGVAAVATPAPPASASVIGDDYPPNLRNAAQDSLIDPWRFYNRECTSFVAWRLNNTNHVGFNDYFGGPQWGNANNWGNAARAVGILVNNTPAVGAVAWSTAGSFGHVAWVANVYGDGSIDIEQYNANYTGLYSVAHVAASSFTGYIHIADLNPASDGSFVSYQGNVYRIAGGAPIYVSTWNAFGGAQPTVGLSDAQWAALRGVPADGTFIRGTATGEIFRVVGGAPTYVSTWNAFGGAQPTIDVDQAAIDNAGQPGLWAHLNYTPADGTFVTGAQRGEVYRFAGGAPTYVTTWNAFGGAQPTTVIDQAALDSAGGGGAFNHVNYRPADSTFVSGAPGGRVYDVSGGVAHYVASWTQVGGAKPTTIVDQASVDNAGAGGLWNHLASATPVVGQTLPNAPMSMAVSAPVGWSGPVAQSSALTTYDARWERAPWNGSFTAWQYPPSWGGVTGAGVTYNGIPAGWDYCYSVRGHDRAGLVSGWTSPRCVARPLDDVAMTASVGWTRISSISFYGGSLLSTTRLNATLTRAGAVVDRIGLLVTTCSTCGSVGVYVNGGLFRTVSLSSSSTHRDALIVLPAFSLRAATVALRVLSSNRLVQVDGIALSRT